MYSALQNAADKIGVLVHEKQTQDKRRTVKTYFLTYNGTSISPVLDYENMNHFLLGMIKAKQIF